MDYPHVKKLYYRVISPEETDYDKASPISGETYDFKWTLSKDQLTIDMKAHRTTEREAREIVEEYLKGWEVTAGLLHGPDSLAFRFSSSIILDRSPNDTYDRNTVLTVDPSETILLSDESKLHVSHGKFPDPPQNFKASPEVEMMFFRYKMYRDGRESLLNMAYWCLTVMEYTAGGRPEASDQYRVDQRVLRKLGVLCSSRGDVYEARKRKGNTGITPLKPAEREWIRAVVKRLILRVGEYAYDPVAKLPLITMSDFPSTT
jgi:hypothetical protein